MQLRPYQLAAVDSVMSQLATHKSSILVAPTGSGKSSMGAEVVTRFQEAKLPVVWMVHRRELVAQARERIEAEGLTVGVIQAGSRSASGCLVQVASVQTLVRRLEGLTAPHLIIIDEAHHTNAVSYQTILERFPEAKLLGLTATPWRLDGKGLSDIFETHTVAETPWGLAQQGFLCPVRCLTYKHVDTSGLKALGGDFEKGELEKRAMDAAILGDVVARYALNGIGKRAIVFAVGIGHSKRLVEEFRGMGVSSEHVDGETPLETRAAIFERFKSGETMVLCNVGIATEGLDLPAIEMAILARPTLSESLYLQMVGRALRTHPGKELALIHDHAQLLTRFGHPYDDRDWSPQRTKPKRPKEVDSPPPGTEAKRRDLEEEKRAIEVEVLRQENARRNKPAWPGASMTLGQVDDMRKVFSQRTENSKLSYFLWKAKAKGSIADAVKSYKWIAQQPPPPEWIHKAEQLEIRRAPPPLSLTNSEGKA